MKKFVLSALLGALLLVPVAQADVTAYVVHGIKGDDFGLDPALPVDVFVSGLGCALPGFKFGDRVGPLNVAAGDYDISIFLADEANPCGGAEVIDLDGVTLPDGANATIIAHRTFDGSAGAGDLLTLGVTASIFGNDPAPTGRGWQSSAASSTSTPSSSTTIRKAARSRWQRCRPGTSPCANRSPTYFHGPSSVGDFATPGRSPPNIA